MTNNPPSNNSPPVKNMRSPAGAISRLIDRTSLFRRRGGAPNKFTAKGSSVRQVSLSSAEIQFLATSWLVGDLRSRGGVVSAHSPALGGGWSYRATIPCDIHGDFEIFEIFQIACVTTAAVRSSALRIHNQSPQSEPAVIVRHRIAKPRLDDELTALDDLRVIDQ